MQKHHDHGNELKWVTTWKVDAADKGSILEHSKYFRQGSSWWLVVIRFLIPRGIKMELEIWLAKFLLGHGSKVWNNLQEEHSRCFI